MVDSVATISAAAVVVSTSAVTAPVVAPAVVVPASAAVVPALIAPGLIPASSPIAAHRDRISRRPREGGSARAGTLDSRVEGRRATHPPPERSSRPYPRSSRRSSRPPYPPRSPPYPPPPPRESPYLEGSSVWIGNGSQSFGTRSARVRRGRTRAVAEFFLGWAVGERWINRVVEFGFGKRGRGRNVGRMH